MHDISPFNPMIERFNHYLRTNLSAFSDYLMWYWSSTEGRSYNYIPRPIEKELIAINNFIFFGKLRCFE